MEEQVPYVTGMMCPECGHETNRHDKCYGCLAVADDGVRCACGKLQEQIERDAWKAEAMAARAWLEVLRRVPDGEPLTLEDAAKYGAYTASIVPKQTATVSRYDSNKPHPETP